jgi:hypothetical protein
MDENVDIHFFTADNYQTKLLQIKDFKDQFGQKIIL